MPVYDADAHVEEATATFSDKYLDPAYRARRPQVIGYGGRPHWVIDYQIFPRFSGPGPHSMGTPTSFEGVPGVYTRIKPESIESMELSDPKARLRDMDEEGLDLQVLYPSLFLAHHLTPDPGFAAALCSSYNRWLADATAGYGERLKWVGLVNLMDPVLAAQEVRRIKELGAVGIMIPGTAGDRLLNHPSLLPFFEEAARHDLPVAVHVGWSSPALDSLTQELYYSTLIPFTFSLLLGFIGIMGSGLLDRLPTLRVAFLEAGCQWIHFLVDRMDHRFEFAHRMRSQGLPISVPGAKERVQDYLRKGNVYFSAEVEDALLPNVIDLVGADRILFASDMPHVDRERYVVRELRARRDVRAEDIERILYDSAVGFYRF
jgi:predicted TIM-barrel fold metal-dependent hydrolase